MTFVGKDRFLRIYKWIDNKKVPNVAVRDYLCVDVRLDLKKLVMKQITHRYLHTLRFSL